MTPDFETWKEEHIRTRQHKMTAGAVVGGVLVLWFIVLAISSSVLTVWPLTAPFIFMAGIVWSELRGRRTLRWYYFVKAWSTGLSTGIYASLFIGSAFFMYTAFINTGFLEDLFTRTQDQLLQLVPPDADKADETRQGIRTYIESMRATTTPLMYAANQMLTFVLTGCPAALVAALFCKQRRMKAPPTIVFRQETGTPPDASGTINQD